MSLQDAIRDDGTYHIQPVVDGGIEDVHKTPRSNAATGASAAGVRAVSAQIVAFYFRAPVKAFFRTRVDYMAYAKAISPETKWYSWRRTTPGLLAHAVQTHGWSFIPQQVLPPLFANVTVGALLYTSYLQILGVLHPPSSTSIKRVFPPPSPSATFAAGTLAGGIQSLVAAPLDALQVRFDRSDVIDGKYKDMWTYAKHKLRDIGARGVFAGYSISFLKDSLGCGVFFMTFEYVKAQSYYHFLAWYYGRPTPSNSHTTSLRDPQPQRVHPHYSIEPLFLLLAGITASLAQSVIQYPLSTFQTLHHERLEEIDHAAKSATSRRDVFRTYYHAYQATLAEARREARGGFQGVVQAEVRNGSTTLVSPTQPLTSTPTPTSSQATSTTTPSSSSSSSSSSILPTATRRLPLTQYLYRNFWWNTIKTVPSTSAGLIIFELVRRKYGIETGEKEMRVHGRGRDILVY